MSYQITSTNIDLSPRVRNLITEKVDKLKKFLGDGHNEPEDVRVVLNKGPRYGYRCKVELRIPHIVIVAKSAGFSLEGTVDEAVEETIRQVRKHKGKEQQRDSKILRKFKNALFFSELDSEI